MLKIIIIVIYNIYIEHYLITLNVNKIQMVQ